MNDFIDLYQRVLVIGCGLSLVALSVVVLLHLCGSSMRAVIRALTGRELMVFAVLASICTWAAQKRLVTFPRTDPTQSYLMDRGSYVDDETSTVHIDFTRIIAPDSAVLYVDRMQRTEGAEWENYLTTTLGEIRPPIDLEVPNATNYQWAVYTDWTPGPTVQTNGVWHAMWGKDRKTGRHAIPVRTAVRVDGKTIATPKSVKDAEKRAGK